MQRDGLFKHFAQMQTFSKLDPPTMACEDLDVYASMTAMRNFDCSPESPLHYPPELIPNPMLLLVNSSMKLLRSDFFNPFDIRRIDVEIFSPLFCRLLSVEINSELPRPFPIPLHHQYAFARNPVSKIVFATPYAWPCSLSFWALAPNIYRARHQQDDAFEKVCWRNTNSGE